MLTQTTASQGETSHWRKIALLSGDRRIDLAMPYDESLDDAVRRLGVAFAPTTHVVLDRTGAQLPLSTLGADLEDGTLLAIVDLRRSAVLTSRRKIRAAGPLRQDSGAVWGLLGVTGALLAALGYFGAGEWLSGSEVRILVAILIGVAAAVSAAMWAVRRPTDAVASGLTMLAPLTVAFAAGVVAVPPTLVAAAQLATASGLLAAAVVSALLSVIVSGLRLRGAAGTTTAILLVLAVIWGVTLWAGWSVAAAAAICAAVVPLAHRAMPSMLVGVAEGYHIDYQQFMSNRWTVRGTIPEDPGLVELSSIRTIVDESSARLAVGILFFSIVPALCLPLVLPNLLDPDPFVFGGTVGLLIAVTIALLLVPRHTATPLLRWVPRAGAALIVIETSVALSGSMTPLLLTICALVLLVLGLIAAATVIPIQRGVDSLAWSRFGDVIEWLAIVLAMPAAFLAADALDRLRGMMAG